MSMESAVLARYAQAAQVPDAGLCCAVDYPPRLLAAIPQEVIDRDYGCGDPSRHLKSGEAVLDLGSGAGKACFIASQIVGPHGRVIGVDMSDDMLALARRNAPQVARNIGYANTGFRKGRIQDLALDLEALDAALSGDPLLGLAGYLRAEEIAAQLRARQPMIGNDSVDVVVSNCVLNLVDPLAKRQVFGELFRVLKPGGRAVISDIVCSQEVPSELQQDAELWSGCIAGAFREDEFLNAFTMAGFSPVRLLSRKEEPWRIVKDIEFRSVTVEAIKPPNASLPIPATKSALSIQETSASSGCCNGRC